MKLVSQTIGTGGAPPAMIVDFEADVLTANPGEVVTFTDLSTNTPTNWRWDFGDGTYSNLQNPTHTYSTVGPMTVTLMAGNTTSGNYAVKSAYILILDADAEAFFAQLVTDGFDMSETLKPYYNNLYFQLKAAGVYTNLDWLSIESIDQNVYPDAREWSKYNLIDPTQTQTPQNPYSGDYNKGWVGDGTSFALLTAFNPGDGGSYNFTRDSASMGVLLLDDNSEDNTFEVSCLNAGNTQGMFMSGFYSDENGLNEATGYTTTFTRYRPTNYCWLSLTRTTSTNTNLYVNGMRTQANSGASTAIENKLIGRLDRYNGSFDGSGTYASVNTQGAFYAGNEDVDHNDLIGIVNNYFMQPTSNLKANLTNRVTFMGDSRTGGVDMVYSVTMRYARQVLAGLGDGYTGACISENSYTLTAMETNYNSEVVAYRNTALANDIVVIWGGTNDLGPDNQPGNLVYADMKTIATGLTNAGYRVIIVGETARNGYPNYLTHMTDYYNLLLADFTDATSEANIYTMPTAPYAEYFIDLYSDPRFQDASDATYYQDTVHNTQAGYDIVASYVLSALNLMLS